MITDTALFRYPHYHKATDTPDKVDYAKLARITLGLEQDPRSSVKRRGPGCRCHVEDMLSAWR